MADYRVDPDVVQGAAVPDGPKFGYFASTGITSVTVQEPCVKAVN
ncbi:hypothetical protein [Frondihabitans sp. VKM Ac-2883]|nr:hypothetical protein [Frondihabitans sp. VKM Ac-2883]